MKKLFSFVFIALSIMQISAQTKGKLTYKMEFSSDKPEMAMALPMLEGSTLELFFAPEKSKAVVAMGSMMKMNTIADYKAKKGVMLIEMMGNKIASNLDFSIPAEQPKIVFTKVDTKPETKDILGYKANKTIIKDESGNEFTVWSTKDLKANIDRIEQLNMFPVDGIPLEFSVEAQGMKSHFLAIKFDKDVDESIFKLDIPEGYKVMTEEELKNMGM